MVRAEQRKRSDLGHLLQTRLDRVTQPRVHRPMEVQNCCDLSFDPEPIESTEAGLTACLLFLSLILGIQETILRISEETESSIRMRPRLRFPVSLANPLNEC
jgi:hypothetical protein